MHLLPTEPPGHGSRKLRRLTGEVERLRGQGYTIKAIHQALQDAGIDVSWATVQREVARRNGDEKAPVTTSVAPANPEPDTDTPQLRKHIPGADLDRFFDTHNSNPLFKRKQT